MGEYKDGVFRPTKEGLERAMERLEKLRAEYEKYISSLTPEELQKLREEEVRELAEFMSHNSASMMEKIEPKLKPLYAFIDENGEYYRGESANYYHIRLWHSEEAAIRYVKQYRAPGKPALTMVRLTAVPIGVLFTGENKIIEI